MWTVGFKQAIPWKMQICEAQIWIQDISFQI